MLSTDPGPQWTRPEPHVLIDLTLLLHNCGLPVQEKDAWCQQNLDAQVTGWPPILWLYLYEEGDIGDDSTKKNY